MSSRTLLLFLTGQLLLVPVLLSHLYASIHEVFSRFVELIIRFLTEDNKLIIRFLIVQVSMLAGRPLLDPVSAYLEVFVSSSMMDGKAWGFNTSSWHCVLTY